MKLLSALSAGALLLVAVGAYAQDQSAPAPSKPPVSTERASYDFGVLIATNLKQASVSIDYNAFVQGMKDVFDKAQAKVTPEEANQEVQAVLAYAQQKAAYDNAAKESQFLADNAKKPGVKTTASGLQYEVIKQGAGPKPVATDTVKVDYVGTLIDGTKFDSSIDRKEPAVFPLSEVIPGWSEAIELMPVGSEYRFYIPSKLAYGDHGAGGKIPPNSTLIFDIKLLDIEKPAAKAPEAAPKADKP
ncbi:MAG: FKBP-type peptidyl-prolyl cis-trans isomerase [Spirochaetales bacterium]|nr:FKBP-type peptidyl-prolyl cis-trans isomerase [Spirochaetales bacterium]